MTTNKESVVRLHVIGAGIGESIVLHLPDGKWGVVDCYAKSLDDPTSNPTLELLKSNGVERLEFLCLTHPHSDHFRGMSQLLEAYPVGSFWTPACMHGKKLSWIVKREAYRAIRSKQSELKKEADELKRILQLLDTQSKRHGFSPNLVLASGQTVLYPSEHGVESGVQMVAIAPSGNQIDRYESLLGQCFVGDRLVERPPSMKHNVVSMAILLEFGETRIVLGGDVEKPAWSDALHQFVLKPLSAQLVKVSHHGSSNGYCENLWATFAAEAKPKAVLTPYYSKALPTENALLHMSEFVPSIASVSVAAVYGKDLVRLCGVSLRGRIAMRERVKGRRSGSFPSGICSYSFDNSGNCLEESFSGAAGTI